MVGSRQARSGSRRCPRGTRYLVRPHVRSRLAVARPASAGSEGCPDLPRRASTYRGRGGQHGWPELVWIMHLAVSRSSRFRCLALYGPGASSTSTSLNAQDGREICSAVMIGDLIAGVYVLLCADANCASLYPRHRIGLAGMVDIPCCISAIGAVNHPPAVQLKEIFCPEFVGFFRRDSLAPILHNELPGPNRSEGKEAEPRSRPPNTKPARSSSFSTGRLPRGGTTFQLLLTLGLLHLCAP